MHASWLAGEGGKRKISLYDACVTDVINSYIQCAKRLGYTTGRYIGTGPTMETLLSRVESQQTPTPTNVAHLLHEAVAGTPMYAQPVLHGDKETVQRKKKGKTGTSSSHRPEYVMESKQRNHRGRPKKIRFDTQGPGISYISLQISDSDDDIGSQKETTTPLSSQRNNVFESDVPRTQWALRRMPIQSQRKCFGIVGRKNCDNILHSRSVGLVAPCIWSERMFKGKTMEQWLWFCNHDVLHTRSIKRQVKDLPPAPNVWPVARGTNISTQEIAALHQSGFRTENSMVNPQPPAGDFEEGGGSSRKKKWRHGISKEAMKKLEACNSMTVLFLDEVKRSQEHVVFRVLTENRYEIHIKESPTCTCPDFQKRENTNKSFLACKHMYYVYTKVLGLEPKEHMIIHQPHLSSMDIAFILGQPRRISPSI